MLINGEIYNLDTSSNIFVSKIKEKFPIQISFIPYIRNKYDNKKYELDEICDIIDDEGLKSLVDNYEPVILFSLFKNNDLVYIAKNLFRDSKIFLYNFVFPSLDKLLKIINEPYYIAEIIENSNFENINSIESTIKFATYMYDSIDKLFEKLNDHIEEVEKILEETYMTLGYLYQLNYLSDNIVHPDLILNFNKKSCGIFRTDIGTTYLLPNGL